MISLDLQKVCEALYRSRCLEVLEGYGVGPQLFRILSTYWSWLRVAVRSVGYYGVEFM